jgi:hypothetical protein
MAIADTERFAVSRRWSKLLIGVRFTPVAQWSILRMYAFHRGPIVRPWSSWQPRRHHDREARGGIRTAGESRLNFAGGGGGVWVSVGLAAGVDAVAGRRWRQDDGDDLASWRMR